MRKGWLIIAGFTCLQALFVHLVAGIEHPPAAPNLNAIPPVAGGWKYVRDDPIASDVAAALGADQTLNRWYLHDGRRLSANLLIAWYRSQSNSEHQPHSPRVCLPAAGWKVIEDSRMDLGFANRSITVNRAVVENPPSRLAVLYWYQTPRRAIAGEWGLERYWLFVDAVRDHRTDTALVRVVVPVSSNRNDVALEAATDFAMSFYPQLQERLLPADVRR